MYTQCITTHVCCFFTADADFGLVFFDPLSGGIGCADGCDWAR